jgi:zinc D-Ala-D-Ala carboxypeptidase
MAINTEELIGKHFKLKHLIYSWEASKREINNMPGIDNSPSQTAVIENLRGLMTNVVDKIVDIYPNLIINSGYRCIKLNEAIGGSSSSQHCYGQAVDIKVPGLLTAELYNYIYANVGGWDQLIWEFPEKGYKSWIHVSYGYRKRRKSTLASIDDRFHNLYGGVRRGSEDQYQDISGQADLWAQQAVSDPSSLPIITPKIV